MIVVTMDMTKDGDNSSGKTLSGRQLYTDEAMVGIGAEQMT